MKSWILNLIQKAFSFKFAKILAIVGGVTSVIAVIPVVKDLTMHDLVIKGQVVTLGDLGNVPKTAIIRMPNLNLEERIDPQGHYEFEAIKGKGEGSILITISLDGNSEISKKLHVNYSSETVIFDTAIMVAKIVEQPRTPKASTRSEGNLNTPKRNATSLRGHNVSDASTHEAVKIAQFGIVAYTTDKFRAGLASKVKRWLKENGHTSIMLTYQRSKFENLMNSTPNVLNQTKPLNTVNYICFIKSSPEFKPSVADEALTVAYVKYELLIVNVRDGSVIDSFEVLEQGPGLSEDKALAAADEFFLNALSTNYKLTL